MLAKRIIPCLDVKDGRVVKGVNFVNLADAGDPVEAAVAYDEAGADELVFLDITASHEGRGIMHEVVRRTASACFMPLTVGGGLRELEDIDRMLRSGADKVSLNTAAVNDPAFVGAAARRFGSQCIVVAIDAKRRTTGDPTTGEGAGTTQPTLSTPSISSMQSMPPIQWEVYTHGGRRPTGLDAIEWARRVVSLGAGEILLTSMDADGTRNGYDLELTAAISDATRVPIIASGGAGTLEHLRAALVEGKADAALAASIFHFGEYTIAQAKEYLSTRGVLVRPAWRDLAEG